MRALLRIAVRNARRAPWRSLVVVLTIAVPVAALILGIQAMGRTGAEAKVAAREHFGRAIVELTEPTGPNDVESSTGQAAISDASGTVDLLNWEEVDLNNDLMRGRVDLTEGRMPRRAGEAIVLEGAPGQRNVRAGETLHLTLPSTDLKVVGVAASAGRGGWYLGSAPSDIYVAPGTLPVDETVWENMGLSRNRPTWFAAGKPPAGAEVVAEVPPPESAILDQLGTVAVSTLAFAWCGMVAASALAIGARRRRRELGLVALNGATPQMLRRVLTLEGAVLGALGAAIGTVAGVLGSIYVLQLSQISPVVAAAAALGWLSAVVTGYVSGGAASRQPTVDLLAGRTPPFGKAPAWLGVGAAAAVTCIGLMVVTRAFLDNSAPDGIVGAASIAGVVTGLLAVVALSTGAIRALPRFTSRAPVTVRLAARDLARFGTRTAATAAAVAITLSAATTAAVGEYSISRSSANATATAPARPHGTVLENTELRITDGSLDIHRISSGELSIKQREQIKKLAESSGSQIGQLQVARGVDVEACAPGAERLVPGGCSKVDVIRATPGLVQQLAAATRNELADGHVVGWIALDAFPMSELGEPTLRIGDQTLPITPIDRAGVNPQLNEIITVVSGLATVIAPDELWSSRAFEDRTVSLTTLSTGAMSEREWATLANKASAIVGGQFSMSFFAEPTTDWPAWRIAAIAGGFVLVVLAILALALVLVRIESRDEDSILRTQGATPRLVASLSGWRAALLTFVAAVPAVVMTTAVTLTISRGADRLLYPRPLTALAIIVGLPVLAGLVFAWPTRVDERRVQLPSAE